MLYNYIKIAFRHLWKNRLYSFINVSGLTVALTCVVLSILYYKNERSFDSFHKNNLHLFRINTTYIDNKTGQTQKSGGTAQVQGPAFKAEIPEISDFVRVYGDVIENVKSSEKAFNLQTAFVDSGFFKIFTFPLLYGSPNAVLKEKYSVVITEKTALKFFGTADVVGKRLAVADNPDSLFASFIITGVAKDPPPNSSIQFDILIPFGYLQIMWDDNTWFNNYLPTFVLLHPKADLKMLQQKFISIHNVHAKEQLEQGRKTGEFDKQAFYTLQPMTDIHLSREGGFPNTTKPAYSYFLVGIAIFILIMASINFINLSIAGSLKRAKEIGIRKISGSHKIQIIWQFLIESSLICITALCLAIILSQNILPLFNQLADRQIIISTLLDWKLLLYFVSLLIVNILLAGLYPAYVLARFKPTEVLYNKLVLSGRNWLGKGLVILQFTIAICLIIGSIIYYRQMNFIRTKDLGYNPNNIIRIDIPPRRNEKLIYATMKTELSKEPGIQQMSLEASKDVGKQYINDRSIEYNYKLVEQSYIPMLEIPIIKGRNFSDLYGTDKTNAIIVNEAFVKAMGLQNPVGEQIHVNDWTAKKTFTIIGVIKDYHQGSLKKIIHPVILAMNDGTDGTVVIKIDKHRTKQSLAVLEKVYKTAVPGAEYSYAFWDELNAKEYTSERKWQRIITLATVLSVLICCLGLFGLTHLATHMRVKEIGIRKVLGASVGGITSLISKDFIKLVFIAVIIAAPIAWHFMNEWLQNFAYRTHIPWWIFLLATLVSILIAFITVSFQAIKAAIANPMKSLRTE